MNIKSDQDKLIAILKDKSQSFVFRDTALSFLRDRGSDSAKIIFKEILVDTTDDGMIRDAAREALIEFEKNNARATKQQK